jgi:hypothetical protein
LIANTRPFLNIGGASGLNFKTKLTSSAISKIDKNLCEASSFLIKKTSPAYAGIEADSISKLGFRSPVSSSFVEEDPQTQDRLSQERSEISNFHSYLPSPSLKGEVETEYPSTSTFFSSLRVDPFAITSYQNIIHLNLRQLFYSYNLNSQSIIKGINQVRSVHLFNFKKIFKRLNTLDALDFTGSRIKSNISLLLKYFFFSLGKALISKPIFLFEPNKIKIQLAYYLNKKNLYYYLNKSRRVIRSGAVIEKKTGDIIPQFKGRIKKDMNYYKKVNHAYNSNFGLDIPLTEQAGPMLETENTALASQESDIRLINNNSTFFKKEPLLGSLIPLLTQQLRFEEQDIVTLKQPDSSLLYQGVDKLNTIENIHTKNILQVIKKNIFILDEAFKTYLFNSNNRFNLPPIGKLPLTFTTAKAKAKAKARGSFTRFH